MRAGVAIYKKELRSYFYSPVAYVLIGIFLFVMGFIFAKFVSIYVEHTMKQQFGQAPPLSLDKLALYLYQNMAFILCFITPFISMRLFAEEKRNTTLELLLTSPVSGAEIVLGKFFAALTLMLAMLGFSFLYAFFMVFWGNPDVTVIATTYLGMVLAISCYLALGGLISAMTASQAIAAFLTFLSLLTLWLLQSIGQGLNFSTGSIEWGKVLVYISPLGHFNSFAEGVIYLKDIIYFVTFTVLALFLTHRVVESHRWR